MFNGNNVDFCTNCRKETTYTLQKRTVNKTIKEKNHTFLITTAVCDACGSDMAVPGLIDQNIQEIDTQYRECEGIVSTQDIENLMKIYKIGKAPLSLVLGFGEVTITRYLSGQIPSKEYSDIIRKALSSPSYMRTMLCKNKDRIAVTAYSKAMEAVGQLESTFSLSDKMLSVISYLFSKLGEVTPLSLQKLLYFVQGESFALHRRPMFPENCQAWVHGPVYPKVYKLFRDFKYNPIDDARFAIFESAENALTTEDRNVIDLVVSTFGLYSGKVLEKITHEEDPWKLSRTGCADSIPSSKPITTKSIEAYYAAKNTEYDFSTEAGLNRYITDILLK